MLKLQVYVVCLLIGYIYARTDEESKILFTKIVLKCTKDHPVEMPELLALQKYQVPTKMDTKCLLACAYKAEGTMTADGKFDLEHGYKNAEISKEGDETRLKNGKKLADLCAETNKEKVSEGPKGHCDRAALIFQVMVTHAPKFGFKL